MERLVSAINKIQSINQAEVRVQYLRSPKKPCFNEMSQPKLFFLRSVSVFDLRCFQSFEEEIWKGYKLAVDS